MKALQGQTLDPIPGHERLDDMPDLDIVLSTRRQEEGSRWEMHIRVNGQPVAPDKPAQDFGAALLRVAAHHLSHHPHTGTKSEQVLYEAREAWWQFRLALDFHVDLLKEFVMMQGLLNAARCFQMSPLDVETLCRSKSSERPNLLAEIGAQKVSRKERDKVRKRLAPPALAAVASRVGAERRRISVKEALDWRLYAPQKGPAMRTLT